MTVDLITPYIRQLRAIFRPRTFQRARLRLPVQMLLLAGILLSSACASTPSLSAINQSLVMKFEQGGLIAKETERGVVVYLPSLMFDFESADLSPLAIDKIIFIAKISNQGSVAKRAIQVEGHTDAYGGDEYNMHLSRARAEAAAEVLTDYSIAPGRIQTAWFGRSRPLVPNRFSDGKDNPQGRAANRRVEFVLLNP